MPRKKNSKRRRDKRKAKQKQVKVELENILSLVDREKRKAERFIVPSPNTVTDKYLMRFP